MEYCRDFKYDLKVGQLYEERLGEILGDTSIEVKTDFEAYRTGNVFVEYESRGKRSGIAVTQAEYYAFIILDKCQEIRSIVLIETERLKVIARKKLGTRYDISGGDDNTSKGVLVKVAELL